MEESNSCRVSLIRQHSRLQCLPNVTFGCSSAGNRPRMYVREGCRGTFRCGPHAIACGEAGTSSREFQCSCTACNAIGHLLANLTIGGTPPGHNTTARLTSRRTHRSQLKTDGLFDLAGYARLIEQLNFTDQIACDRERFRSVHDLLQNRSCRLASGGTAEAVDGCCTLRSGFAVEDTVELLPRGRRLLLIGDSVSQHAFDDLTFLIRFAGEALRMPTLPNAPPRRWVLHSFALTLAHVNTYAEAHAHARMHVHARWQVGIAGSLSGLQQLGIPSRPHFVLRAGGRADGVCRAAGQARASRSAD